MNTERIKHYETLRRKGLRAKNQKQSDNINPGLLVLDDVTSGVSIISEVSIGMKELKLCEIVGTLTHSRALSFGPNFLPIMKSSSEFATKWMTLYEAQINEGIRDPIEVYEFLNQYYVAEGNKRVSVLKSLDAFSIPGYVTRLIPRYDENNPKIVAYYEYLKFSSATKIDYICLSNGFKYKALTKWVKKYQWDQETHSDELLKLYKDFKEIFLKAGGNRLHITTSDAFVEYLDIYTYNKNYSKETLRQEVKKMWDEFALLEAAEAHNVETISENQDKKTIFSNFVGINPNAKVVKIAFVNSKSPKDSRWTYEHELGRLHVEDVFSQSIKTTAVHNVTEDENAYEVMHNLAKENYDIIFSTAPTFNKPTLKAALDFKDTKFLNCSENVSYKNIRTYFGIIYQPNFLVGLIAGALSKTNKLGYVATYPVPEVINCINAFTLGARFVNPEAKIYTKWTSTIKAADEGMTKTIDHQLATLGVDLVIHEESTRLPPHKTPKGIYFIGDENDTDPIPLAAPVWNWGIFYEKLINNILSGAYSRFSDILGLNDKAINYRWGMNEGVVDIIYSERKLPRDLIKTVTFLKKMIETNEYIIFNGPLYSNKGELMVEAGEIINAKDILHTNWLVEGVIGSIPKISEHKDVHPLLEMVHTIKR